VISGAKQPLLSFVLAVPAEKAFGRLDSTAFQRRISIEELWKRKARTMPFGKICDFPRESRQVEPDLMVQKYP
jgi:hypothetical protein